MPRDFDRMLRIGDLIQRELATLIQREIHDPRLGMVTVSAVKVTGDMSLARVYVTRFGNDEEIQQSLTILKRAAKFLRGRLAKTIHIRYMPALEFIYDETTVVGNRIQAILDNLHFADDQAS